MSKLKVPSLQHLARNWRNDPDHIRKLLVALVRNAPTFNYNPLFSAVRDLLVLGQEYEQIEEGIRRGVKRPDVRKNFLGVLPLIRDHFDGVTADFVQSVDRRYYPVGRGLMVPFEPPLIYGVGGQFYFPWFSFWRQNPLAAQRLALFVTLVDEVLLQDPDMESARFEILDFSAPDTRSERELRVIRAEEIPRLSESQKIEMLDIFAEGYFRAMNDLARESANARESAESAEIDPRQPTLFD